MFKGAEGFQKANISYSLFLNWEFGMKHVKFDADSSR